MSIQLTYVCHKANTTIQNVFACNWTLRLSVPATTCNKMLAFTFDAPLFSLAAIASVIKTL